MKNLDIILEALNRCAEKETGEEKEKYLKLIPVIENAEASLNGLIGYINSILDNIDCDDISVEDGFVLGDGWDIFVKPIEDFLGQHNKLEV